MVCNNVVEAAPKTFPLNKTFSSSSSTPTPAVEAGGIMKKQKKKGVIFSHFSELAFIPKDESETKWYTKQEKRCFRKTLMRDSRRMSKDFEQESAEPITVDQLYECVGIEIFGKCLY